MSSEVLAAIHDGQLSGVPLRVYAFMARHATRRNRFEGTQRAIAEALGVDPAQVSRAFKALATDGYLIRVSEARGARFWYVDSRRTYRGSAASHPASLERQARQRERDRRSNVVPIAA